MSSILRALKKLDENAMSREPGTGEQIRKIEMKRVVTRRIRTAREAKRKVIIVMLFILLAVGVLIFINVFNTNKEAMPVQNREHKAKKPGITPGPPRVPQIQTPPIKKEIKTVSPGETPPAAVSGEKLTPVTRPAFPAGPEPPAVSQTQAPPEFVLNGVLWSDNPGRRVALINNWYLKEGEEIEGVTVVKIEKKSVILRSGEKEWTLNLNK